jgi:hypothetical protein
MKEPKHSIIRKKKINLGGARWFFITCIQLLVQNPMDKYKEAAYLQV